MNLPPADPIPPPPRNPTPPPKTPTPPPEDTEMADGTAANTMTAEKLDAKITVKDYDGNRKNFQSFADAIRLYFGFHEAQYKEHKRKKIMFVLSKLTAGEAELWRRTYMQQDGFDDKKDYKTFWDEFTKAFQKENEADQAMLDLHSLKQGTGESAETVITRFRNLAALAKIPTTGNDRVAIDYLRNVLHPNLVNKVTLMIDEPTTFEEWVNIIIKHDNVWRRARSMKQGLGRPFNPRFASLTNGTRRPTRDPDAMDVDALTMEERKELLEKRACFFWKKPGHFAKECRSRQRQGNATSIAAVKTSTPSQTKQDKKLSTEEAARTIRTLLAQYTALEENEIFEKSAKMSEEQDFQ
jgi:hypothetical protein